MTLPYRRIYVKNVKGNGHGPRDYSGFYVKELRKTIIMSRTRFELAPLEVRSFTARFPSNSY
jgi:hypothetical protein